MTACWVESAAGHAEFPPHNLPLGVFEPVGEDPRVGVAIGDFILDLRRAAGEIGELADLVDGDRLNDLFAAGREARSALRARVQTILAGDPRPELLHPADACRMHPPAEIGDYTDFYAGIHHARAVGALFRPDNPLLPNYKHVPIGYHGRASSVRVSGEDVRRPIGQIKRPEEDAPVLGPSARLDYELELGIWIGPGNALGEPIPIAEAADHVAGYCLLNDWSARDVQTWEYQPLGPFLAKNFHTTISPWVVTPEALAPFRIAQAPRPEGDPAPLPYLLDAGDQATGALAVEFTVWLRTARMIAERAAPFPLGRSEARHLYWTPAQLVVHHTIGGCDLRAGDLFGSGTISGPGAGEGGSLLELTRGGREPLLLPGGETRRFLEDGDEVRFTARATAPGIAPIGFGACVARVIPALGIAGS